MKKRILLLSILAAILLVMPLLDACGGESTVTATTTATTTATATITATATATIAKPEGTFTWGAASLGTEGFCTWVTGVTDALVYGAVYDPIALKTPTGEPIPCVAESWEFSEDYEELTLHIREGIQFNGGWGELTADDVAYVLDGLRTEDKSSVKSTMDPVESVEVTDRYTVVLHHKYPTVDYPYESLFAPEFATVLCKAYVDYVGIEEASLNPVGSGPYQVVEHRAGNYIKYEAVEDHWRVVPEFKYLVIKAVPEESTRIAMLKTGDIDATVISDTSLSEVEDEANLVVDVWTFCSAQSQILLGGLCRPGCSLYQEGYHNQDPWADIRVREAMNISIDRDAINEALHYGTAQPLALGIPIPGYLEVEPYPYDPERAEQLLAEAAADGVFTPNSDGGFDFTLINCPYHPGVPLIAQEAVAVVGYWSEVGIHADISPIDFLAYNPKILSIENAGDCVTYRQIYMGPNAFLYLRQFVIEDPIGNKYQCEAADVISPMAEAALAEMDLVKRDAMYKEIAQLARDSFNSIPLFQVPTMIAKNKTKVGDWPGNIKSYYFNFEYIRHAEPLNTFRLFELE
jgi:peptide/nickel transport system substrate-binding protein